ncbi:MAG: SpoIIE family protein phosphatase [Terracidiphilus sp.]|jgi:sigma-B regulation protein RsbU (phosphoserine phosphatase)
MRLAFPSLVRLIRQQIVYIVISAVLGAIFWAIGLPINPYTVLLYTLCIGNLLSFGIDQVEFLFSGRPFPFNWLIFLPTLLALTVPVYLISTAIVWFVSPPSPQTLSHLLLTGWKFPFLVTFVFGFVSFLHQTTKDRLEQRNQELERSVKQGAAQLEKQEEELQRAREIQQSLLPKEIPQLAGFEVAGAWRPARTVSGDYYDVFKLDGGRLGICIADVVGKGVSAALLMANVQAAVRAYAGSAESPAQLCAKVNSLLCENLATGKFVTFLYGVLDGEKRTLEYCNAGHLYPILVSQGSTRALEHGGAVLGVFPTWEYENAKIEFRAGDRLLLVTDGITEASGADEVEFGEEKLAGAALKESKRTAAEMCDALLNQVTEFCEAHFQDDATLLVIAAK